MQLETLKIVNLLKLETAKVDEMSFNKKQIIIDGLSAGSTYAVELLAKSEISEKSTIMHIDVDNIDKFTALNKEWFYSKKLEQAFSYIPQSSSGMIASIKFKFDKTSIPKNIFISAWNNESQITDLFESEFAVKSSAGNVFTYEMKRLV